MFIVWCPIEFSRLHNLHPWYWNSLLYCLISCGENSVHFLQLMPFTVLHVSFHQIPITAGWTEAAWYERLAQHSYTWPAAWRALVTHPSSNQAWRCLTSVFWWELVTTRPCATTMPLSLFHNFLKFHQPTQWSWFCRDWCMYIYTFLKVYEH